jgi:hypothetical protein
MGGDWPYSCFVPGPSPLGFSRKPQRSLEVTRGMPQCPLPDQPNLKEITKFFNNLLEPIMHYFIYNNFTAFINDPINLQHKHFGVP